jgi:hypothetical protein
LGLSLDLSFFSILKDRDEAGNKDIDTHSELVPELAPFMSNYILSLLIN